MAISPAELDCARDGTTDSFPEVVAIKAATRTSDGAGGYTTAWTTVATVAGMLTIAGAQATEPVVGDRQSASRRYALRVPHDTTVTTKHRAVFSGRTFEIVGVGDSGSLALFRTLDVVELT